MDTIIERLKAAGVNVKSQTLPNGNVRLTMYGKCDSHPKEERITIDVDSTGLKVINGHKYTYCLPESVGDDIRLG